MKLGYSKINIIDTHKSRSLDFSSSDLTAKINSTRSKSHFDQIQTETETTQHSSSSSASSSSSSPRPRRNDNLDDHPEELGQKKFADHHKAVFGSDSNNDKENSAAAVLRRNSSVSSMSAVKRVFSMRRCSSVSEGYSRIHDQSVTLASPVDDEEEEDDKTRSAKKKHRGGKILKACKRLFRL
ncbi:hypothetical protein TIFTF001_001435 [Ficus carica]|uniref:Uncharacterized protein n=1 Tax=Ficus carica TaxID=3494 RepID=A0AA87YZY3_FICCA|nr:hypothetical protein TIFTF001_001435 [Ficus carica]